MAHAAIMQYITGQRLPLPFKDRRTVIIPYLHKINGKKQASAT
jgi:hypothetical protein